MFGVLWTGLFYASTILKDTSHTSMKISLSNGGIGLQNEHVPP